MGFRVLKGGLLTTVQDIGRTGYQSQGFGTSGVMDVRSFKIANMLIDNPENEAVLEFTMIGPTLEFTSETIIAITGGDFQPLINKKPAQMYTAISGCKNRCERLYSFFVLFKYPCSNGKPFYKYKVQNWWF